MVQQSVLPFKLDTTNDQITANAGLILFGEFMAGLNVGGMLDDALPAPGSSVGYTPSEVAVPIMLMLQAGGRSIEDLREVSLDQGFLDMLKIDKLPSTDIGVIRFRRSAGVCIVLRGRLSAMAVLFILRSGADSMAFSRRFGFESGSIVMGSVSYAELQFNGIFAGTVGEARKNGQKFELSVIFRREIFL